MESLDMISNFWWETSMHKLINFVTATGPHGSANIIIDDGEWFKLFCSLNYISIGNKLFKYKDIHKTTWLSPDHHTKNEIDHISISCGWHSSLQDVMIYKGSNCGSDHFSLITRMELKFKKLKQAVKKMIFDTT